jgi:hypothetical protein
VRPVVTAVRPVRGLARTVTRAPPLPRANAPRPQSAPRACAHPAFVAERAPFGNERAADSLARALSSSSPAPPAPIRPAAAAPMVAQSARGLAPALLAAVQVTRRTRDKAHSAMHSSENLLNSVTRVTV